MIPSGAGAQFDCVFVLDRVARFPARKNVTVRCVAAGTFSRFAALCRTGAVVRRLPLAFSQWGRVACWQVSSRQRLQTPRVSMFFTSMPVVCY